MTSSVKLKINVKHKAGKNAITNIKATALTDPKSYVDTILDIHRKYHSIVTEAFENDNGFATSLDRAASDFVNTYVHWG